LWLFIGEAKLAFTNVPKLDKSNEKIEATYLKTLLKLILEVFFGQEIFFINLNSKPQVTKTEM